MLGKLSENQIQSDVIRKVLAMLNGMKHSPEDSLILNHVALMLEDHDAKQAETEQLLCSLIVLILGSFSIHLQSDSTLLTKIKLLQFRLMSPLTNTELVAVQHYVEACADNITQMPGLNENEIEETLKPLLNSFGLNNNTPLYKVPPVRKKIRDSIPKSKSVGNIQDIDPAQVDVDESLQHLLSTNYFSNSIEQSEKFGVLLEVELATLKSLDDDLTFGERKKTVLNELEKVLASHQRLTQYFQKMSEFVSGLQQDSIRLNDELDRVTLLSLTDELTGLPNRRAFEDQLEDEIARAKRYGYTVSLAILDIDHFKPINDEYGHGAGDKVLKNYAANVLSMFRQHDMVARYGGEEFVVIFPNTDIDGALKALEKVKQYASQSNFALNNELFPLPTFSAGLVYHNNNESKEDLIHRADKLLYKAKSRGRNCIVFDTELVEDIN